MLWFYSSLPYSNLEGKNHGKCSKLINICKKRFLMIWNKHSPQRSEFNYEPLLETKPYSTIINYYLLPVQFKIKFAPEII